MVLLRCHLNQVVTNCRDVLFPPRDDDVLLGADCWIVLLLPREYVVDKGGGYIEVDYDSCLPVAIVPIFLPSNHGGGLGKVATL